MNAFRTSVLALAALALAQSALAVQAQEVPKGSTDTQVISKLDPHLKPPTRRFESPERFLFEFLGGPYKVFSGDPWSRVFGGDSGPNLGVQLDGIVYRLPKLMYFTVGGSFGWIKFSGKATAREDGTPTDEETTLAIFPLIASAGIRIDALPRQLKVPLIFAARIGWEFAHWDADTGARDDAAGWSVGPVISGQVAIDLDTFEPGGARALDEEWGINHTYLFGEVFHFATTGKSLEIGTTSWLLGLGFVF